MKALNLILAEAELELVPDEIAEHEIIKKHAKKRGKKADEILLDSNLHYKAMKKLKDFRRRGRPDIVHITLLSVLDSPLNKEGMLKTYVHTRNDECIFINPEVRLPRSYTRFCGVIEKLFKEKIIKADNKPLLELKKMSIKQLVESMGSDFVVVFDEKEKVEKVSEIVKELKSHEKPCAIIGAFPHGSFKNDYSFADRFVAIYKEQLSAWSTASLLVNALYIL